jgi:hypothetical protein
MNLAVVGLGLVSPSGMSPAEHVFFARARLPAPPPRVFLDADDQKLAAIFCPVIGARASMAERLGWLGTRALASALAPLREAQIERPALLICAPAPRPGVSADDVAEAERALTLELGGSVAARAAGEAGVFSLLPRAERLLTEGARKGGPTAVVMVGLDSFVSIEALAAELRAESPWSLSSPPPSEGAGALALMLPAAARSFGVPVLGSISGAAVAQGAARDDNDDPVDGAGMTTALRALPGGAPVQMVFGQQAVDELRLREWQIAVARCADRFDPDAVFDSVEAHSGRVGAAAGVMGIAHGMAVYRHGAGAGAQPRSGLFHAWAISRDGTRGIALCRAGAA